MNRPIIYLFILFLLLGSSGIVFKNHDYCLPVTDSLQIEIEMIYDEAGIPDQYKAHIHTPICEAGKCYSVEIIFYWDLVGRFLNYDTIPGAGLTKLDHQPFQPQDFFKLGEILKDDHSILASFYKEELVRDSRISEIDGFTGATANEIKESVVEGAVYSCYTLWHIAHGPIVEELKKTTKSMLDKSLVQKLVNREDQEINYFLIDQFSTDDFMIYKSEILQTLYDNEGYYIKNAIEKMPLNFFTDRLVQSFFARNFSQLNYFAQVALLEKLLKAELTVPLLDTLRNQSTNRNTYKNELIKLLLTNK